MTITIDGPVLGCSHNLYTLHLCRVLIIILPFSTVLSVSCLQCYTDVEGSQVTTCNELEGFKTCFTKYNDSKWNSLLRAQSPRSTAE